MQFEQQYEMVIVGAGPAGLSAARTAARLGFRALVIDRQPAVGQTDHPCQAVLAPIPGLITARPLAGGLLYPQVDLWLPEELIRVPDAVDHYYSPTGYEFQTITATPDLGPTVVVDKGGLLQAVARQATTYGAELLLGVEVFGLINDGSWVTGVRTSAGDIMADIVISAEGLHGRLAEEAGLRSAFSGTHTQQVSAVLELDAPQVREEHLGRLVTFGQRTPWSSQAYATLLMPAPGKAQLTFTGTADFVSCAVLDSVDTMFGQYRDDERVAGLLADARIVSRSTYAAPMDGAPVSLASDSFLLAGDAAAPGGRMGILQAVYFGRQAALFAAEGLDTNQVSAAALADYDRLFRTRLLPGLESEQRTAGLLLSMSDAELDRVCELLNRFHLPVPFDGHRPGTEWETFESVARRLPIGDSDRSLLQQVLGLNGPLEVLVGEGAAAMSLISSSPRRPVWPARA